MTWDAYDARTLRHCRCDFDCAHSAIQQAMEEISTIMKGAEVSDSMQFIMDGLDDTASDIRGTLIQIEEALANTPEGREIARQERPVEPIRV